MTFPIVGIEKWTTLYNKKHENDHMADFLRTTTMAALQSGYWLKYIVIYMIWLGNDHLTWRGGYVFFLKKYSDSQCCWKKYSDFGGEKKK
jgi:hypothetical protein